jgi:transcriptional regulator with XRE-family HTH domain
MASKSLLGKNLADNRKRWKLTQRQVAERLGVHPMMVSQWERGVYEPEPGNLNLLARLFSVSTGELRFGAGYDTRGAATLRPRTTLGRRLLDLRESQDITQARAAKHIGVSVPALSSWERDEEIPEAEHVVRFAELVDLPVSKILAGTTHVPHPRLARNLRHAISESGFTEDMLAEQLDVFPETIFEWMAGVRTPTAEQLEHLGMYLAYGPKELLFVDLAGRGHPVSEERALADAYRRSVKYDLLVGAQRHWHTYTSDLAPLVWDAATGTVLGLPEAVTTRIDAVLEGLAASGADQDQLESADRLLRSEDAFTFFIGGSGPIFPTKRVLAGIERMEAFLSERLAELREEGFPNREKIALGDVGVDDMDARRYARAMELVLEARQYPWGPPVEMRLVALRALRSQWEKGIAVARKKGDTRTADAINRFLRSQSKAWEEDLELLRTSPAIMAYVSYHSELTSEYAGALLAGQEAEAGNDISVDLFNMVAETDSTGALRDQVKRFSGSSLVVANERGRILEEDAGALAGVQAVVDQMVPLVPGPSDPMSDGDVSLPAPPAPDAGMKVEKKPQRRVNPRAVAQMRRKVLTEMLDSFHLAPPVDRIRAIAKQVGMTMPDRLGQGMALSLSVEEAREDAVQLLRGLWLLLFTEGQTPLTEVGRGKIEQHTLDIRRDLASAQSRDDVQDYVKRFTYWLRQALRIAPEREGELAFPAMPPGGIPNPKDTTERIAAAKHILTRLAGSDAKESTPESTAAHLLKIEKAAAVLGLEPLVLTGKPWDEATLDELRADAVERRRGDLMFVGALHVGFEPGAKSWHVENVRRLTENFAQQLAAVQTKDELYAFLLEEAAGVAVGLQGMWGETLPLVPGRHLPPVGTEGLEALDHGDMERLREAATKLGLTVPETLGQHAVGASLEEMAEGLVQLARAALIGVLATHKETLTDDDVAEIEAFTEGMRREVSGVASREALADYAERCGQFWIEMADAVYAKDGRIVFPVAPPLKREQPKEKSRTGKKRKTG